MRIETKAAAELSQFEKARSDCVVTSSLYAYHTGIKWADPDWAVMVWEDDELVTTVQIVERLASVGSRSLRLGGIGNVSTKVEWRKRGFATAALKAAQEFLAEPLKVDFGLMICTEAMIAYYEKKGWKNVAASLMMEQEQGKLPLNYPVMVLPVVEKEWPEGPIDLLGLPW